MDVTITSFTNPFSFFCLPVNDAKDLKHNELDPTNQPSRFNDIADATHGQYVAVMWKNKWARGVISMETQFLIWLIDYGIYLRPSEKNVYIHLPLEHRHHPTKVFEAGIHGVLPISKVLNEEFAIEDVACSSWNKGAVEKAQELISTAASVYFIPITILSTQNNDIVLGNLFLDLPQKGFINIIDELQKWPVFLLENKESYITQLQDLYITRRKHRANVAKPVFPGIELPCITAKCTIEEYNVICDNAHQFELHSSRSECGSTVVGTGVIKKKKDSCHKLTPEEIEKYSQMYIQVGDTKYNVLNVLLNKIRDLIMCERYKDYDKKSLGRAYVRNVVK